MPCLYQNPLTRRRFIGGMMGALSAVSLPRMAAREPVPDSPSRALRLALFSDTHIPANPADGYRGFRPVENLNRILPQMIERRPEAAILCGDAARLEGLLPDYERLGRLLDPLARTCPISIALGNHDDRTNFWEVFARGSLGESKTANRHVLVIEWPVLRCIVLDSLLFVNETPGLLGKAQRFWLADHLARTDDRPTVLFVHHPPTDDDGALLDSDRLLRLVQPHRKVKAIFFGHTHVWAHTELDGLQLINLPAVGYNFSDLQPVGWVDSRFGADGVDLTLCAVAGNRSADGSTVSIAWKR
ncbi:MAG: metallophosphoesterase [Verrucomicrobiales bacterium]|nr:metallophosphoesterase [Verrucomicrobiales bacterium]MCP5527808.1 metallophosphoesterase [Verrucomicrobiales bacterium]